MKVQDLEGSLLDYWVAKADGLPIELGRDGKFHGAIRCESGEDWYQFSPSTSWGDGGPLIERKRICIPFFGGEWAAYIPNGSSYNEGFIDVDGGFADGYGPTPLIAAMRAYVASVYGDEVPDIEGSGE